MSRSKPPELVKPGPPTQDEIETDLQCALAVYGISAEQAVDSETAVLEAYRKLLAKHRRLVRCAEVCDELGYGQGRMSNIVGRLVRSGKLLVARNPDTGRFAYVPRAD
jgi:hypothetical protein